MFLLVHVEVKQLIRLDQHNLKKQQEKSKKEKKTFLIMNQFYLTFFPVARKIKKMKKKRRRLRPMDKAFAYGAKDCRFESCVGNFFFANWRCVLHRQDT